MTERNIHLCTIVVVGVMVLWAIASVASAAGESAIQSWKSVELTFTSDRNYTNPYTDLNLSVEFTSATGAVVNRPGFWDGGKSWRVRFLPTAGGQWTWKSACSQANDSGLQGKEGSLSASPYVGTNLLLRHGLLRMSPGHRNVIHSDGTPFLVVADTAWSLPWRGTVDSVSSYAEDRQSKGFNAVLLMSVQPDRNARGPRDRDSVGGFDVGFEDLPEGHLNQMNVAYFQTMDKLIGILVDHGIVPVYQPVFQGYGWKGLGALGRTADPAEIARYCRYLVARYGDRPAFWLVGADGTGLEPSVEAGGVEIYANDAYHQPIGIHYSPADEPNVKHADGHHNRSHQDAEWLDFQWCQTGHDGVDNITKVSRMHDNKPIKAVANGEPTYEGICEPTRAEGWWQGNEAWSNLTAGGTMGVAYGAPALWQWKLTPTEPGWPTWAIDDVDWRGALKKEGSLYVGYVSKAFADYDFTDMTKHPELAGGKACIGIAGKLYVVYLPTGGDVTVSELAGGLPYLWFNPKTSEWKVGGETSGSELKTTAPDAAPWVLFVGKKMKGKYN
jgi:hypothetical protein